MEMLATVLQVNSTSLLVRDSATGEEVRVNTRDARRFSPGNRIRITFSGAMTNSIPPQISAMSIQLISGQQPPSPPQTSAPSEIRCVIIQRARNSLRIRDLSNNRQFVVRYRYAYHFCVGQMVRVRYDTITMSNPPEVTATDIIPMC